MSESTTSTDPSASLTEGQKAAVLQEAVIPWSGTIRDVDALPDAGPLAMVWTSGFNAAVQLMQSKFNADDVVMVSGTGPLSQDFNTNFGRMMGVVTPGALATLQNAPSSLLVKPDQGDTAAPTATTTESPAETVAAEAAAATGAIAPAATTTTTTEPAAAPAAEATGTSAVTQGEVTNTTTAADKPAATTATTAAPATPTTGGAATPATTTTPINPSSSPTA